MKTLSLSLLFSALSMILFAQTEPCSIQLSGMATLTNMDQDDAPELLVALDYLNAGAAHCLEVQVMVDFYDLESSTSTYMLNGSMTNQNVQIELPEYGVETLVRFVLHTNAGQCALEHTFFVPGAPSMENSTATLD